MSGFIIFILVLFVLAALLRVDFFFTILYLFIGVYVVTRFWARRIFKSLSVKRRLPQRAFLGEEVTVTFELKNLSLLPIPWLVLNESFSPILSSPPFFREVVTLAGKASHKTQYTLTARRRGYYQIGPLNLETGDFLGIHQRLASSFEADYLIVYPKIVPISRLGLPAYSPQVILPTTLPLFRDPSRITGVRNYVPGDNPRHIHWPATATTGQMLVKQFQTAISRDNTIFLNLDLADYGRTAQANIAIELAVIVAASLANHMIISEELPVGLTTTAVDPLTDEKQRFRLAPAKGQGFLMQILEILARIEGTDDANFLDIVQQEAVHLSWGTTIVMITSVESEALLKTVLLLKRAGFHISLVLVQPMAYTYPHTTQVQEMNIPTFIIRREKDIEEWFPTV